MGVFLLPLFENILIMEVMEMTRFAVQRCIGNTIEVLGSYEAKEEMLAAKDFFVLRYAGKPGIVNGISGNLDENGRRKPGEVYRIY